MKTNLLLLLTTLIATTFAYSVVIGNKTEVISYTITKSLIKNTIVISELNQCLNKSADDLISFVVFEDDTDNEVEGFTVDEKLPVYPSILLPGNITFDQMYDCLNQQNIFVDILQESELEFFEARNETLRIDTATDSYSCYNLEFSFLDDTYDTNSTESDMNDQEVQIQEQ